MEVELTLEEVKHLIHQQKAVREQQGILRAPVKEKCLDAVFCLLPWLVCNFYLTPAQAPNLLQNDCFGYHPYTNVNFRNIIFIALICTF